jgi:transposase
MSMARLVVTAVRVEGRSISAVARDDQVSRRWIHELLRRYDTEGEPGLQPRSRRPHASPQRTPDSVQDEIVALRKTLTDQGLDAGAQTIACHLAQRHGSAPAPSTIWRILTRRGFVTPQPRKRPRSSWRRFEADQPNERWQADITHWTLASGRDAEILNVIDDHARLALACAARPVFKAADVLAAVTSAISTYGIPAAVLTDNGAVFAGGPRGGGRVALEVTLTALGVSVRHARPTTRRPAARSSASTRPSNAGSPASPARPPPSSSRASWTPSGPTTTPSAPTARWTAAPPPRPTPPGPKPPPVPG